MEDSHDILHGWKSGEGRCAATIWLPLSSIASVFDKEITIDGPAEYFWNFNTLMGNHTVASEPLISKCVSQVFVDISVDNLSIRKGVIGEILSKLPSDTKYNFEI